MKVVWSPLAIQRVLETMERIAWERPKAAVRWATGAFDCVGRLEQMPLSGRMVPETGRNEIREVIYGAYRFIFRVEVERVLTLTVRHSRQLWTESESTEKDP